MIFSYDKKTKMLTINMKGDTLYYKNEKAIDVLDSCSLPFTIKIINGVFWKDKEKEE